METNEANSPLGLASRFLAFALIEQVGNRKWHDSNVNKLQGALYDYGVAIAKKTSMLNHTGF